MFISVDGKAKEVKEIFAGGADGKAHRVKELYGSVDGIAKKLYTIEEEVNGFTLFSWEEIKQLADEGKLLEHFNLYDKVKIKLNKTLSKEVTYWDKDGTNKRFTARQDHLILQITTLTENYMRLSSPYSSIFCRMIPTGVYNDDYIAWQYTTETKAPFEGSSNITVTTVDYSDSFYWIFNDALPEEVKAVANGTEKVRSTVSYSSGGTITNKENCYIRNLSQPVAYTVKTHTESLPYWYEITESQFPRKKSAYMYHFALPEDYGKNGGYFASGMTFFRTTGTSTTSDYSRVYYCCRVPLATWSFTDRYVKPIETKGVWTLRSYYYANQQGLDEYFHGSRTFDFIPELSIGTEPSTVSE